MPILPYYIINLQNKISPYKNTTSELIETPLTDIPQMVEPQEKKEHRKQNYYLKEKFTKFAP